MIMKYFQCPRPRNLIVAILLSAATALAVAADPVTTQGGVQQPSTSRDQTRVQTRFTKIFGEFAGSGENAQSLYSGLRNGTQITLSSPASTSGGTAGTSVVQFDPPTRPMGNGNVFISLALAKQQLANYGNTDPTPQQIQAALTGGTIVPADPTAGPVVLKGILVQRADGMGWGRIAKASGMNLGKVVSGIKSNKAEITAGSLSGGGVTTATGAPVQSRSGTGSGGHAPSTNRGKSLDAPSRGVVTAAGDVVGAAPEPVRRRMSVPAG